MKIALIRRCYSSIDRSEWQSDFNDRDNAWLVHAEKYYPLSAIRTDETMPLNVLKRLREVGDNILRGFTANGNPYRIVGSGHGVY
jgi:hypothetical protein